MFDRIKIRIGKFGVDYFERHGLSIISTEELDQLRADLKHATQGRCTCNCGRQVNNAWRDSDGYHCITCLADQRDAARSAII